eukprot:Gb_06769 [translate_table: standard]
MWPLLHKIVATQEDLLVAILLLLSTYYLQEKSFKQEDPLGHLCKKIVAADWGSLDCCYPCLIAGKPLGFIFLGSEVKGNPLRGDSQTQRGSPGEALAEHHLREGVLNA